MADRVFADALEAYEAAAAQTEDAALLARIETRIALIELMQDIQTAAAKGALPDPLPEIDIDRVMTELGAGKEGADELRAAHQRAQKLAEEAEQARRKAEAAREAERTVEGWVYYVGPGFEAVGATHKIIRDGRVLALLKSGRVNLDSFLGVRVRVTGSPGAEIELPAGGEKTVVLDVLSAEIVLK